MIGVKDEGKVVSALTIETLSHASFVVLSTGEE